MDDEPDFRVKMKLPKIKGRLMNTQRGGPPMPRDNFEQFTNTSLTQI